MERGHLAMKGIENVSLVREQHRPEVYLIVGDTKFWIVDPNEFNALGFDWNRIRVVDDGTLGGFTQQLLHATPATRPSDVFFDCGQDGFVFPAGNYYWNCKPSASLVRKDVLVAGWLTHHDPDGPDVPHVNDHGDAPGIEDVHYNLSLDAAFLDRMYGPNGLSKALNDAVWPGNPPAPIALPFANVPLGTPSAPKGVDFNSWILLGNNYDLHGELNAWHTQDTGHEFSTHFKGRGPHPESWVNPLSQDTDAWFPFHPLDPEGTGQQLQEDDYVLMRGTLWQDVNHGAPPGVWDIGPTVNHTGWSEFHPIDWIIRVRPPQPNVRLTKLQVKNAQGAAGRWASGWGALEATYSTGSDFRPSAPNRMLQLRWVQGLIDNRVTNVVAQAMQIKRFDDHIEGHLTLPASKPQLRFKATWLLGWSEIDPQMDQVWVNDQLPPLAALY